MRFSALYKPTALFSLKDSNSTSSGAKSLFLPSPYAIKMAFLSQAISLGGENFTENKKLFEAIRDAKISYFIKGDFCVNNCFIKIQKQRDKEPFRPTVSFREYLFISDVIEIIFDVNSKDTIDALKKYLFTINYFGKRSCFFQFIKYQEPSSEPNVKEFDVGNMSSGILQEYDDFNGKARFDTVNSFSSTPTKRDKKILVLPLKNVASSKSYNYYKVV